MSNPHFRLPRAPRHTPVESFGPELMALLIKAAVAPVQIALPYRRAVRLRQRLYQLRVAMNVEKHPKASDVRRVRITISWPPSTELVSNSRRVERPSNSNAPCFVTVSPQDSEFFDALHQAGVKLSEPDDDLLAGIEEPNR